ncbi:glutamate 5-kinase [Desulfitobacterium metallireducens]|uniref:Glutamate 5-kinase n=1 Tax=Desulfitobacterium metallireducens DSM 15288 TaxID=871968 RepID=W0EBN8_9FIRM|nr:glutamate 5-kinase [Desulfitobacterium metallireducens]AHF06619.1 gamma-glutamyl kinase [Desulfitobacterium metallireducens DSM 15288]
MSRRIVIKIGSSSLNHPTGGLDDTAIENIVKVISEICTQGIECILVSSGAVAAGVGKLGLSSKPKDIAGKQAVASIGQGVLIEKYAQVLDNYDLVGAQVLLSRIDLADSSRYKNAQNTLEQLLKFKAIPIINENDTVAVEELCFGDNDRLSALVAGIVHADLLVIFTDVDGLYTSNPKTHPGARLIEKVEDITKVKGLAGGAGSKLGTGGMITKIKAAEIATRFGIGTYLVNSSRMKDLPAYFKGENLLGTYFVPTTHRLVGKKRWIAYGGLSEGSIIIDEGAVKALAKEGKSLLATGIIGVEGEWERKELIRIVNAKGMEIGRGLVELSSEEVICTQGKHSEEVLRLIPDLEGYEIVHRDNMTLMV